MWTMGRAIFTPGQQFEQTWQKSTKCSYISNIKALGLEISDKTFKEFIPKTLFLVHLT